MHEVMLIFIREGEERCWWIGAFVGTLDRTLFAVHTEYANTQWRPPVTNTLA